jgi:hypothetical protein
MARVFFPVGAICRRASVRLPEQALFNMQQSTPFSSSVPNVIHSFLFYFYFLAMAAFDLNLPLGNNDLGFDLNVGLEEDGNIGKKMTVFSCLLFLFILHRFLFFPFFAQVLT